MSRLSRVLLAVIALLILGFGLVAGAYARHQRDELSISHWLYLEQMIQVNGQLTEIESRGLGPASAAWGELAKSLSFETELLIGSLGSEWPPLAEANSLRDTITATFRWEEDPSSGEITIYQTALTKYVSCLLAQSEGAALSPYLQPERPTPFSSDLLRQVLTIRQQQYLELLSIRDGRNRRLFYATISQYERALEELLTN